MLAATPGYCTLIARSRPSRVLARCTCPIEAAAIGLGSRWAKPGSQPLPHWAFRTSRSWRGGIGSAASRSRAMIEASSGGRNSPASIEISCPIFIAAPRMRANSSVSRRILPGVSSRSRGSGRAPRPSWRAPSKAMFPAMPVAMPPSRASRVKRPLGTVRPGRAFGVWSFMSCQLSREGGPARAARRAGPERRGPSSPGRCRRTPLAGPTRCVPCWERPLRGPTAGCARGPARSWQARS